MFAMLSRVLMRLWPRSLRPGGSITSKTRPKGTISARVYRAATDTWEDRGVISRPEGK